MMATGQATFIRDALQHAANHTAQRILDDVVIGDQAVGRGVVHES
jgi:hypothetical protein